jgi:hypothetical protein
MMLTTALSGDGFGFKVSGQDGMPGTAVMTREQYDILRVSARNRQRRIIFTNDGCDATTAEFGRISRGELEAGLVHAFLNSRRCPPDGSQIDTLSYCTSFRGLATHRSVVQTEYSVRHSDKTYADLNLVPRMRELGTDPLREQITLCRSRGMEIFHSMRMNDTHDAGYADNSRFSDFKLAHPELLFGVRGKKPLHGQWTAMDFGNPMVRDFVYRSLEEVVKNYDVDGIEMDFFRHPQLFRSVSEGKTASKEELDALTELMIHIRATLDETGRQRGRAILLSVRAPDSVEYCRAIGIDLERWLELGLVDLYTAGGYFRLNTWTYSVDLARRYGVKICADLSESRMKDGSADEPLRSSIEAWRGRAAEAWNAGVDSVSPFNLSNAGSQHYLELGSPDTLRSLNRIHFATTLYTSAKSLSNPGFWVKGGRSFLNLPVLSPSDPITMRAEGTVQIPLYNAVDDLLAETLPKVPRVVLRVKHTGECALQAKVNGYIMEASQHSGGWSEWSVPKDRLRPQVNIFEVLMAGASGRDTVLIQDALLNVDF